MKKIKFLLLTMIAALVVSSCGTTSTVPVTGRKHNLLVTDEYVLSLSNQEYTNYMKTAKISTDATNTAMVKRVGERLANAVETYLKNNGMASDVKNFSWTFNLVQDKSVNAFCMPGGKIVVYEGLLPVTQNEASLAVVLGHEIAHAVAKHSAEQMSKQMRQQYGTQIGAGVLNAIGVNSSVVSMAEQGAGTFFQFKNLKYSRADESEADHMGLIFAAMAGYDPNVAVSFWQRMAASSSNGNQNDIFSDHPSDAKRISAIKSELSEALKYYTGATTVSKSTPSSSSSKNTYKRSSTKKTTRR